MKWGALLWMAPSANERHLRLAYPSDPQPADIAFCPNSGLTDNDTDSGYKYRVSPR